MATILEYKFINGDEAEILVEDVYAVIILADRTHENTRERKHRGHKAPLDTFSFEDRRYFADENTPETILIRKEESRRLAHQFEALSDIQKRRILMYLDGFTCEEIAKMENVSVSAVAESLRRVREKMKHIL